MRTVGALVPNLKDVFYMEILQGALEEALKHHFDTAGPHVNNDPQGGGEILHAVISKEGIRISILSNRTLN